MRARWVSLAFISVIAVAVAACTKTSQTTTQATPTATEQATAIGSPLPPVETPSPASGATAAAAPAASPTVNVAFTDINGIFAQQAIIDEAKLGVFDSTTGTFDPQASLTRGDFVKWLVKANNAYYQDASESQIRLAEGGQPTFVDVATTHPDYPYVQALANAGFVIGVDDTHFAPDRDITREEMIAIKVGLDLKGDPYKNTGLADVRQVYPFADVERINKRYYDAIYGDDFDGSKNIPRVFGAMKRFNPQQPVTRAEAALCIDKIGTYSPRTAERAVAAPAATP